MVPTQKTIRLLFARSGNRCAFVNCYAPLVEENDSITGEVCHIRARNRLGPRYDPSQPSGERDKADNLILLCSRHHKIVDDEPMLYTVDVLKAMKKERESIGPAESSPELYRRAGLLREKLIVHLKGNLSVGTIHTESVIIRGGRSRPKIVLPSNVIGSSSDHRAYLKYLIDRYQTFAKVQGDRVFKFSVVFQSIKRKFKADWEWIPLSRFEEVVLFLREKIDGTMVGRQQSKRGELRSVDFDSYRANNR